MKIALVCDWLTNVGGAEKVLLELHRMFPSAPIYTSKYSPRGIDWFKNADVRTGWLQIFPTWTRRFLGPLRQKWFARLDLSEYDLVISVTGAEAKFIRPRGTHICYCHAPTQYYWQLYDDYVRDPGFGALNAVVRFSFVKLVKKLRQADFDAAKKVDHFVTISTYTKSLIKKYYHQNATVVHPPVDISNFSTSGKICQEDFYVTTSRQVNWKKLDLAIKACLKLNRKLIVIGEGPEHKKLVELAKTANREPLIEFLPLQPAKTLAKYLFRARGYIFPSLEPFGIAPVEALAAGCPVIAFGEGGALDYIKDGRNGVLFSKQTTKSLISAIERFEKLKFDRAAVSKTATNFSAERFRAEIKEVIKNATA